MKQSHLSSFGNAIDLLHAAGTDKHEKSVSLWKRSAGWTDRRATDGAAEVGFPTAVFSRYENKTNKCV